MADDVMERLDSYFEVRAKQRQERFEQQWGALSGREQRLVREAAVMGFVRGHYFAGGREEVPLDSVILRDVLTAADAFGDIYKTLHRAGRYPSQRRTPPPVPVGSPGKEGK